MYKEKKYKIIIIIALLMVISLFFYFNFYLTHDKDEINLIFKNKEVFNIDEEITPIKLIDNYNADEIITPVKINSSEPGTFYYRYIAKKNDDTKIFVKKIIIKDNQAPVITLFKNTININEGKNYDINEFFKVNDNYSSDNNITIKTVPSIMPNSPGTYKVKIIATDEAFNSSEEVITIEINKINKIKDNEIIIPKQNVYQENSEYTLKIYFKENDGFKKAYDECMLKGHTSKKSFSCEPFYDTNNTALGYQLKVGA